MLPHHIDENESSTMRLQRRLSSGFIRRLAVRYRYVWFSLPRVPLAMDVSAECDFAEIIAPSLRQ
jgi:hypothetical protein